MTGISKMTAAKALFSIVVIAVQVGIMPDTATAVTATFSGATTQSGRIFRDANPAICPSKSYPGIFNAATTYNYETFTYHNSGGGQCVTFSFDPNSGPSPCGTNAHLSVYLGSYDPNNQAVNFLGDVGSSITATMSVDVPANTTAILVVTNTAGQAQCSFTVSPTNEPPTASATSNVSGRAAVAIRNFMSRRADIIAGTQVNTSRFHRRLGASAFGNDRDSNSGSLSPVASTTFAQRETAVVATANDVAVPEQRFAVPTAQAEPGETGNRSAYSALATSSHSGEVPIGGGMSFDTSLQEIRAGLASQEAGRINAALGIAPGGVSRVQDSNTSAFDIWAKGTVTRYKADLGGTAGKQSGPSYII